jgi:hypothetical protein
MKSGRWIFWRLFPFFFHVLGVTLSFWFTPRGRFRVGAAKSFGRVRFGIRAGRLYMTVFKGPQKRRT